MTQFAQRAAQPGRELNFVRHSWTASQLRWRPSVGIRLMDARAFWLGHTRLVDQLLVRSAAIVAVAGAGLVAGWLAYEPDRCIHYIYTDSTFRRLGVARDLLANVVAVPKVISHWTPMAEQLFPGYLYDPTQAWWRST